MPEAEYPDTRWVGPPRAYGKGRDGKAVRLSVVHYTAGSETRSSAENGAAYDKIRTDGTSCHVFHDPDSSLQEVLRRDRSNSAHHKGNRLGIHHELCGTAQTRAQWLDEASDAILWRAARAVAKDCVDYGLEPRRLSVAEVRASWYQYPAGPRGICGHVDITRAFPEDGGDHTDPGTGFPWDIFLDRVQQTIAGGAPPAITQEDRMLALVQQAGPGGKGTGPVFLADGVNPLRRLDDNDLADVKHVWAGQLLNKGEVWVAGNLEAFGAPPPGPVATAIDYAALAKALLAEVARTTADG